ncbi:MAG TPA: tRNA (adenosine(37)-N6)-dimethylallyltransferase MiaA [Trueperaceae bacterium]|nr:tRNA (adenosine(37)-N6)-dimethylallyltransferase MiaA [Trueperaceae bacterium]
MLAGPTASGKSGIALLLAEKYGLEIVTADAMQVYRGMDIGTAKPTLAEQRRVKHHVLDVVTPAESYSVAAYVAHAHSAIAAILERGSVPVVVGGTGFYLRALREGLPTVPEADAAVQAPLWSAVERGRLPELMAELEALAPIDAARAGANPRRVVRNLEVLRRTGRPPSAFEYTAPRYSFDLLVLAPPAAALTPRIVERTKAMFAAGLVGEVSRLLEEFPAQGTALQAIGYKEVVGHVRGGITVSEASESVTSATLRYAKRQRTWFKAEKGATVVEAAGADALPMVEAWLVSLLDGRG